MHTARYYLIRRIVRYSIWVPVGLYCYMSIITGWVNAL